MIYRKQIADGGDPQQLGERLKKSRPKKKAGHGGHGGHGAGHTSIRTAEHDGHTIEIRTTYEVIIDGKKLTGHLGVENDGRVHYHAIPAYSSASMVDLCVDIIDNFPDDFPDPKKKKLKAKKRAKKKAAKAHKKQKQKGKKASRKKTKKKAGKKKGTKHGGH